MTTTDHTSATNEAVMNARAWIDAAESRWRLQIFARRTRLTRHGVKMVPTRIRRFVEGLPWSYLKPAMDYLLSKAPYRGAIANGVDFGIDYRPTLTVWQRDAQSAAVGAVRPDATYTLVQDLIEADADDVYAVGTSSSCSETVESEYVWDAAEVGELPQGGVGVTYQIANVHRNEDGTFDYAIVKRTALTQHAGPFTEESGPLRRVVRELWDNVYTDASGAYVDETGAPVGIPSAGTEILDDGRVVSVKIDSVSENPDCTLKISVQTEELSPATVRELTQLDRFRGLAEREVSGEASKLPDAPDASGGVITRHQSKLRPDGSWDNEVHVETERPVRSSVMEVAVGRKGTRTTVKSDNQPSPARTSGLARGESVRVEKTPGGLYTNTVTTFNRNTSATVGSSCKNDQYQHVHSKTAGSTSAAVGETSWGGGYIRSAEASMDDDGAITRTDRTEFEKTVHDANVSYHVGLTGVTVTRKRVATGETIPASVPPGADVGTVLQYEKTPGGLVTVTETKAARPGSDIPVTVSCESTALAHTMRSATSVKTVPALNEASVHTTPGGGRHSTTSYRRDEQGGCVRETVDVQEQDVVSEISYEKKPRGTIVTKVWNSTATSASVPARAGGMEHQVLTEGGRHRLTRRTFTPSMEPDRAFCSDDKFVHQHDDVRCAASFDGGDVRTPENGVYRSREQSMDSDGFVQIVERVHTEHPVTNAGRALSGDYFHTVSVDSHRTVPQDKFDGQVTPDNVYTEGGGDNRSMDREMSQGGMWSGKVTVDTPRYRTWTDSIDTQLYKSKTWFFRNANLDEYTGLRGEAEQYADQFGSSGWIGGTAPTSLRINGGPTMNGYGLFDGSYTVEASWDPVTGGADNDRDDNYLALAEWGYTIVSNSYNIGYSRNASQETITAVHRTRSTKTIEEKIVSGYKQYLASHFQGKKLIEGTHVTVTPTTGVAHGVVVTEANTTISVEMINNLENHLERDWTVE